MIIAEFYALHQLLFFLSLLTEKLSSSFLYHFANYCTYQLGGDEASVFALELFKMYQKYAAIMGWRWEEMSFSKSDVSLYSNAYIFIELNMYVYN